MRQHDRRHTAMSANGRQRAGICADEPVTSPVASSSPAPEATAPSGEWGAHFVALGRSAEDYVRAEAAAAQLAAVDAGDWILWKLALLGVGVAVVIIAAIHLAEGTALGLTQALGGNAWLGHLLTGAVALLAFGGVAVWLTWRENRWRQRQHQVVRHRHAGQEAESAGGVATTNLEATDPVRADLRCEAEAARQSLRRALTNLRDDVVQAVDPRTWLPRGPQATSALFLGAFAAVNRATRRAFRRWRLTSDSAALWDELLSAARRAAEPGAASTNSGAAGHTRAAWSRLLATCGQVALAVVLTEAWRGERARPQTKRPRRRSASGTSTRRRRRG